LISHSIFFLTYILRTLTTTTEGWWHMHAVTSTSNQRPRFHVRKIQRLITFHSNTNFLSLLPSAPCPISVGTPFIYGKDSSFYFSFSLFSLHFKPKNLSLLSLSESDWPQNKDFTSLHFKLTFCVFFSSHSYSLLQFHFNGFLE